MGAKIRGKPKKRKRKKARSEQIRGYHGSMEQQPEMDDGPRRDWPRDFTMHPFYRACPRRPKACQEKGTAQIISK